MKKTIVCTWVAICVAMLAFNFNYTYKASREARLCYHLAHANVRDGYMDEADMARVKRFVSRQHSIMFPGSAYERLRCYRNNLQRQRLSAIDREMRGAVNGAYCALKVNK